MIDGDGTSRFSLVLDRHRLCLFCHYHFWQLTFYLPTSFCSWRQFKTITNIPDICNHFVRIHRRIANEFMIDGDGTSRFSLVLDRHRLCLFCHYHFWQFTFYLPASFCSRCQFKSIAHIPHVCESFTAIHT